MSRSPSPSSAEASGSAGPAGSADTAPGYQTIAVEIADGVAWVALNRPHKHNAMSPALNEEMVDALIRLEADERVRVLVLTGAGDAFSAGMDLQEYFRDVDGAPAAVQDRIRRVNAEWQWKHLMNYAKPTIAMVNGWCNGGAFTPLVACDLAVAAEEAVFSLSEVDWGIPPGGVVSRALAETMGSRDALFHIMTGKTFDGRRAAEMGLVNFATPLAELRAAVTELANVLKAKNPVALRAAKQGFRTARLMPWDQAEDYLYAKLDQSRFLDPSAREAGMGQFFAADSAPPSLAGYQGAAPPADQAG